MKYIFTALLVLSGFLSFGQKSEPTEQHTYVISQLMVKHYAAGGSTFKFPSKPDFLAGNQGVYVVRSYAILNGAKYKEYICRMKFKGGEWSDPNSWALISILFGGDVIYPRP